MDPTSRKPKPSPSAAAAANNHRHPHPVTHTLPDPTAAAPPSAIQTISNRLSKLYTNHKKVVSHSSTKPSPLSDSSCTTLTKSISHHGRSRGTIPAAEKNQLFGTKIKVREKDDFKKPSFDEIDAEKELKSMVEEEKMKGVEMRGRNSLSSIPPAINGGRRRSFCNSHLELADFFSCSGVKVVAVDMPPFMQIHAVNCARKTLDSLEKFTSKTLAFTLKKEFDGEYGLAWHCIVGTSFGSFVTHSVGGFMYFSMDQKQYILLFKTAVQRAQ